MIVESLTEHANKEWKCYKVILNSLEKNVKFYQKLGFEQSGFQLKFVGIS